MSFKKYLYKKVIAAATALTMVFAATGCGESTAWIAKYDDLTVNAGIFIFYQTQAYSEATSILTKDNEDLDISDTKLLKTMMVENTDITQWINNKATESVRIFMAVNHKFDELGLELTEEEKQEIESTLELYWSYYSSTYEVNGIGKDSFKQMIEFDYKKRKVFFHYYDIGGEYEYSDNEIMSYLEGNYARTKVIQLQLRDGNNEELDEDGKKEIKAMAEDYRKRAIAGENFDDLMEEYSEYRAKLAEEAQEAEEDEETEDPEVTDDQETTDPEDTDTSENEETSSDEGSADDEETVNDDENTEETANDDENADEETVSDDENTEDDEETEDSQTASEDLTDEDDTENGEEENDEENGDEENSDEENTEDENSADGEDVSEDEESEETDEEKDPFDGETIYFKGSEEDGYSPSEKVNKAIFDDCFVNGDPVIIEDEDNLLIYVVQRLDILERTDLFEGEARQNLLLEILEDEFENKALEWMPEDAINKNTRAYKRYDPFKIQF